MPRYFFDLQTGAVDGADATGSDLAGEAEARAEAVKRATQACGKALATGEACQIALQVREGDHSLFVVEVHGSIVSANPHGDSIDAGDLNSGNDV